MVVFCTGYTQAQIFSDDFESYNEGDYIGQKSATWTTWSGNTGNAEDAKVVTTKAKSGEKSIYFYSTGFSGGPQDIILPFGQKYTTGVFTLKYSIYLPTGSEAYMNFQAETKVGESWSSNSYFTDNGLLKFDASGETRVKFNYDEWTDVTIQADLTNKIWTVSINGACAGSVIGVNGIASLDIFPLSQNSGLSEFWIDDVSFDHQDAPAPKIDAAIVNTVQSVSIEGSPKSISVTLMNGGSEKITSVDLSLSHNGNTISETFNVDIDPKNTANVTFSDFITPIEGSNPYVIEISKVNGATNDENTCNNALLSSFTSFKPAKDKAVLVEEKTGTWCGWCPRGAVAMERMKEQLGDRFVGLAVHGGGDDPMIVPAYASYINSIAPNSGYPAAIIDRKTILDPGQMESAVINQLLKPTKSKLEILCDYNEALQEATIYINVHAKEKISTAHRVWGMIIENNVTGTTSAYDQANYYAGGNEGVMGGYESLPHPVPAEQMVYNETARAFFPGSEGQKISSTIPAGEIATYSFTIDIDENWDTDKLYLVTALTKGQTSEADNALQISLRKAIENFAVSTLDVSKVKSIQVYPNPTSGPATIQFTTTETSDVHVSIHDMSGKHLTSRSYSNLNGTYHLPIDQIQLQAGSYIINITSNGETFTRKLIKL